MIKCIKCIQSFDSQGEKDSRKIRRRKKKAEAEAGNGHIKKNIRKRNKKIKRERDLPQMILEVQFKGEK